MPADYIWSPQHDLIVSRLSGVVLPEDIVEALAEAIAHGCFPAGADRLTLVDQDARMHRLDLAGLRRIQTVVAANERRRTDAPSYRGALVCADAVKRPIMELYRMLWAAGPFSGVKYYVAAEATEALDWLGRPPDALDHAPPRRAAAGG